MIQFLLICLLFLLLLSFLFFFQVFEPLYFEDVVIFVHLIVFWVFQNLYQLLYHLKNLFLIIHYIYNLDINFFLK
jgi:hypothetical protein